MVALTPIGGVIALVAAVAAQPSQVPRTPVDLDRYNSLVAAHRTENDDAVREIAEWDRERLGRLLSVIDTLADPTRPWSRSRYAAAVMLHTDVALYRLNTDRSSKVFDQFVFADRLLQKANRIGISEFGSRWYVALSRHLRNVGDLRDVEQLLEMGRTRFPMDAGILYESATLQELLAGRPSLQTLPMLSRGDATSVSFLRVEGAIRDMRQRRAVRLEAAAKWLRATATIDPSSLNTRLHLARVVMLQGDDESALTSFNELRSAPGAPALIAYRASLFAGAVHERRGRLQEAADAYSAATLIVPNSQTAHVALSAALQRAGRGDEARAALAAVMNNAGQEPVDTAWTYFFDVDEVAKARLDPLRAEAWK